MNFSINKTWFCTDKWGFVRLMYAKCTDVNVYNIKNSTLVHLNSIFIELLKYIYTYIHIYSRKKSFSTGSGYMRVYDAYMCTF